MSTTYTRRAGHKHHNFIPLSKAKAGAEHEDEQLQAQHKYIQLPKLTSSDNFIQLQQ
jgi:hypothetical protein